METRTKKMNIQLKARNQIKNPKPMETYLKGKDLYNKCIMNPGWNKDMAVFNAYKHEYTNYNRVVTDEIYHADLSWQESVDRMKAVYQQLMTLVPERYKEQCKQSFLYSIKDLKEFVLDS